MMKLSLACGLALSAAVAAYTSIAAPTATTAAAPAGATVAPAAATASPKPATAPKLVCESVNEMGSHMKKRVCLTPEQMAQRHKDSQQAAQDFQNRPHPVNANGKPPA
jgi:invasion protein IalB